MKFLKHLSMAIASVLALFSCTGKDALETTVTLTADVESIPNDGTSKASFTVSAGDEVVTAEAVIYMNGEGGLQIVEGGSFSSLRPGEFEFYAIWGGAESNRVKITVTDEFSYVTLKASTFNIPDDGVTSVDFTVFEQERDVTQDATVYLVGGQGREPLEGKSFCSTQQGSYQFVAEYAGQESEPVFITVESPDTFELPTDGQPQSTDFRNRVMLMKNTGTGCAYCPLVSAAIKEVLKDKVYEDKMSVVELHNFNDSDPMMNQAATRLRDIFGVNGWPLVIYNMRGDVTSASEGGNDLSPQENMDINISTVKKLVDQQHASPADAAISAVSKAEGNVIKIKAAVKAGKTAAYTLGVFLLEDNIKAPQNEYGPDTEAYPEDFDPNKHMNVLRATYDGCDIENGNMSGMDLGTIEAGQSATADFEITVDKNWILDNCHLMFYVCSAEDGKPVVRNAEKAGIGQKVAFRYN